MKAKVCSMLLLVALALSLGISAGAANGGEISPQYDAAAYCTPVITFTGRNATCSLSIRAKESAGKITATMTLYKIESNGVLTRKAGWSNLTGTGRLDVSKPYSGTTPKCNYRLSVSGTIKDSTGTHPISAYRDVYCP